MPSRKHSRRPSAKRRSRPLIKQLSTLQRHLQQALQANRRQQTLRRQRQQRLRSTPAPNPQLIALRRALEFRWLQRQLQRRQRQQPQPSRNPIGWLWPRTADGLTTREAAALLLRHGATAVLLLMLVSLVLNALPLQLLAPSWYLQILAYVAENVPVLILASAFALLSLVLANDDQAANAYRIRLLRISRLGYILALLLLPLQLGFTTWLYGQAWNTNRTQLTAIRANANALISGAQQTSSTEQFVAYLRSRNITANLESIAAAPLAQVRSEFVRSVKAQQQQQEQTLGATTRSTLLRYTTNSLKLFATLLILAGFLRGFQALVRRCSLQRLSTNQSAGPSPNQPVDQPADQPADQPEPAPPSPVA